MFTLNCKGRLLVVDNPLVMGIINATPDSFYEGSRFTGTEAILQQAEQMLRDGADILDIGGQSTRPGSLPLTPAEELERIKNAIAAVHYHFPQAFISVDTYVAAVAVEAVAAGACIVNDVSGGTIDPFMIGAVGGLQVPYICMHMKGTPDTMQQHAIYKDLAQEILDYFIDRLTVCNKAGIKDVIIDPGFGFAKTIQHNFELLNKLSVFRMLEKPIMIGVSRKSTIYKTLGVTAEEALNGSTVLHTMALMQGANILRVHDVKEAKEAVTLFTAYKKAGGI